MSASACRIIPQGANRNLMLKSSDYITVMVASIFGLNLESVTRRNNEAIDSCCGTRDDSFRMDLVCTAHCRRTSARRASQYICARSESVRADCRFCGEHGESVQHPRHGVLSKSHDAGCRLVG